jgi:hypothetical protein
VILSRFALHDPPAFDLVAQRVHQLTARLETLPFRRVRLNGVPHILETLDLHLNLASGIRSTGMTASSIHAVQAESAA